MNKIVYSILIIIAFSCGCAKNKQQTIDDSHDKTLEESAFSPLLTKELLKFMKCNEDKQEINGQPCPYWINFYKKNGNCYLLIALDMHYDKNYIVGYSYLKGNLVTYYKPNTEDDSICTNEYISMNRLIKFEDSIPRYSSYQDLGDNIPNVDLPFREYRIINKDSLLLVDKKGTCPK